MDSVVFFFSETWLEQPFLVTAPRSADSDWITACDAVEAGDLMLEPRVAEESRIP